SPIRLFRGKVCRMRSMNPVLSEKTLANLRSESARLDSHEVMTVRGAIHKSITVTAICFLAALTSWNWLAPMGAEGMGRAGLVAAVGGIGGLIAALVLVFKKQLASVLAPAYALLEGLALGAI